MQCSNCGSENPSDRKFCGECGAQFLVRCPKCGKENVPPFRFCGECGAALANPIVSKAEETKPITATAGERRHLTVLFCDLVGSTAIAAQLDPEEWREIVASYHHAATAAITGFCGHVAQYLGDGVMAFFGWPEAHENDAERAVRAGLGILESISQLNEKPTNVKLAARVGIHSGAVVVGGGMGKEADVFGDVPSIASRIQSLAEPGGVLISGDTHRLISGLFVVEDHGAQSVKGIERAVQLNRVIQPSGARGRLQAVAAARGLTRFVGREEELRALMSCWKSARNGKGQVALIMGEPGIGKSRLVHRFREQIVGHPHTWIEAAASPFHQNTPFYAVSEMVRELLLWRDSGAPEEQLKRLEYSLELSGVKPTEAVPLIAPLLNPPVPTKYPPSGLSTERQRRRLLAILIDWLTGASRVQPLVIFAEDLHWADPSTLEFIQLMVAQTAKASLLLLHTARPEFGSQGRCGRTRRR